jgi:hypothetical protein
LTIHVIGASEDSELWQGHPDPSQECKAFDCYVDALAKITESYMINNVSICILLDPHVQKIKLIELLSFHKFNNSKARNLH